MPKDSHHSQARWGWQIASPLSCSCLLLVALASGGCCRFRCGPAVLNWQRGGEMAGTEVVAEEVPVEATEERVVGRFHPVPAWDVFHPPVDLSYDDPVANDRCIRPFYLPQSPVAESPDE